MYFALNDLPQVKFYLQSYVNSTEKATDMQINRAVDFILKHHQLWNHPVPAGGRRVTAICPSQLTEDTPDLVKQELLRNNANPTVNELRDAMIEWIDEAVKKVENYIRRTNPGGTGLAMLAMPPLKRPSGSSLAGDLPLTSPPQKVGVFKLQHPLFNVPFTVRSHDAVYNYTMGSWSVTLASAAANAVSHGTRSSVSTDPKRQPLTKLPHRRKVKATRRKTD